MASTPQKMACNSTRSEQRGISCQYEGIPHRMVTSEFSTSVEPSLQTVSESSKSVIGHNSNSTPRSSRAQYTPDITLPREDNFRSQIDTGSDQMVNESKVCRDYAADILAGLSALGISVTNHHFGKLIDTLGSNPIWSVEEVQEDVNLNGQFQVLELKPLNPLISIVEYQGARDKYSVDLAGIGAQYR